MADNSIASKIGIPVVQYAAGLYESTTSFTIGATTTAPTPGAGATFYRRTTRDGDFAYIRWEFVQTAAGSGGSGTYRLAMPSGITIDTSRLPMALSAAGAGAIGYGAIQINSTIFSCYAYVGTTNQISISIDNQGSSGATWLDWGSTLGGLANTTIRVAIEIRIPIAEWAGQAYQAYGAGQATSVTPGLVMGGTVPGSAGTSATAAGNIGEIATVVTWSITTTNTASPNNAGTINLTPGVWLLFAVGKITSGAAGNRLVVSISDTAGTEDATYQSIATLGTSANPGSATLIRPIRVTSAQNYYATTRGVDANVNTSGYIQAVRIG